MAVASEGAVVSIVVVLLWLTQILFSWIVTLAYVVWRSCASPAEF